MPELFADVQKKEEAYIKLLNQLVEKQDIIIAKQDMIEELKKGVHHAQESLRIYASSGSRTIVRSLYEVGLRRMMDSAWRYLGLALQIIIFLTY
jgi:hypothetical protein